MMFGEPQLTTAEEHIAHMLIEYRGWKDRGKALAAGERIASKCAKACER